MQENLLVSGILALCLVPGLVACTSEGGPPAALVGVWTDCRDGSGSYTFGADGSYAVDKEIQGDEYHEAGTYTASGTTLFFAGELEDGTDIEMELTYYVNATHFVPDAAYPQGDHSGPVGTWKGHLRFDSGTGIQGTESTMELRADNTGTIRQVPFDGSEAFEREGTWGPDEDENNVGGYELEFEEGGFTVHVSFQIIDDAVLGTPSYCKASEP